MRLILIALLCVACGDDDGGGGTADAALRDGPVGGGPDAPPGTVADAGAADVASSIGDLCATTAFDGGPGSCPGAICCNSVTPYMCTLPDDCPGGTGYVACETTANCPGGRICCQVPGMRFCTKDDACAEYGGTEVP